MIENIDKTTTLHLKNEAQFLCFTLEEEQEGLTQLYAMNVFKVREIIYYNDLITETEGDNTGVLLGFLTVRDETIPLVDMRRWIHYNPSDPYKDLTQYSVQTDRCLVVICDFSNYTVGLKIRNVKRIIQKSWNEVNMGSEYGIDGNSKVTATTKYDNGEVVQILDVERMVVDAFPMQGSINELDLESIGPIMSNRIVLLAEDSKPAAKNLQHVIEKLELQYFTFPNGKGLLDYLNNAGVVKMVGAIITDIEMPVISGFEVLKRVKENPETAHIPVIIMSSFTADDIKVKAINNGAVLFLEKPFDMDYLAANVENLLNKSVVTTEGVSTPLSQKLKLLSQSDKLFLAAVDNYIKDNISDVLLNNESMARHLNISVPTLQRKVKSLTGLTPNRYIRKYRMDAGAQLLATGKCLISEISYNVGFNSASYFSKCFKEEYGCLPQEYVRKVLSDKVDL